MNPSVTSFCAKRGLCWGIGLDCFDDLFVYFECVVEFASGEVGLVFDLGWGH